MGAPIRCDLNGQETYDRLVGICYNARGQDIAAELVRLGLALDCARFSHGRYRSLELRARASASFRGLIVELTPDPNGSRFSSGDNQFPARLA